MKSIARASLLDYLSVQWPRITSRCSSLQDMSGPRVVLLLRVSLLVLLFSHAAHIDCDGGPCIKLRTSILQQSDPFLRHRTCRATASPLESATPNSSSTAPRCILWRRSTVISSTCGRHFVGNAAALSHFRQALQQQRRECVGRLAESSLGIGNAGWSGVLVLLAGHLPRGGALQVIAV